MRRVRSAVALSAAFVAGAVCTALIGSALSEKPASPAATAMNEPEAAPDQTVAARRAALAALESVSASVATESEAQLASAEPAGEAFSESETPELTPPPPESDPEPTGPIYPITSAGLASAFSSVKQVAEECYE